MNHFSTTLPQLKLALSNVERWLDKAAAFAESKKFEPNTLLAARLAPDQFSLARQVQSTCDQAKFLAARLSGKAPPQNPDTEQTLEELRKRVQVTIQNLDSYQAADFEGADEKLVRLPYFPEGKALRGIDYVTQWQLPNFYFHACMVYAILRKNGVDLGKADFIGAVNFVDM